ncbi:calcium-binding protein [Conexibacter sp. CPCC 205706]|uniref:calcium-binding protein n=1 Tax=Conexibacter sp. CPCC 205706 TaxID=3064572 RepID=UPI00272A5049|nr:calcium-binding protein [Conexibacter sp. CPCC 205706]
MVKLVFGLAVAIGAAVVLAAPAAAVGAGDTCPTPDPNKNLINSDAAVIYGTARSDFICGGPSANLIIGGELDDDIYGAGGNDIIIGGHGTDLMDGGSGNDWLRGGTNRDCYIGGDGNDTASFADMTPEFGASNVGITADLSAADGTVNGVAPSCDGLPGPGRADGQGANEELADVENVVGSAFDDTITGSATGASHLSGGWGDDVLNGRSTGTQDDPIDGDEGNDSCLNNGAAVSCGAGGQTHRPSEAFAAVDSHSPDAGVIALGAEGTHTDSLTLTRTGSSQITLTSGDLLGGTATCPAASGPPSTVLNCSIAAPRFIVLWGGDGDDTLTLGSSFPADESFDLNGGPGNDHMIGSATGEVLYSGAGGGNDTLDGNGGDDALISEGDPIGSGGDTLNAGGGDDQIVVDNACSGHTLWGGPGNDIIGFARQTTLGVAGGTPRGVNARLGDASGNGPAYAIDAVGVEVAGCLASSIVAGGETLEGTQQNDILSGNNAGNTIWARAGDDTVFGNGGDDLLKGQNGDDTIHGGDGADNIVAGPGDDTLTGDIGADTIDGEGNNDTIYGDAGDDMLFGLDGDDTINGDDGNDTLNGNAGNDTLTGDAGVDSLFGGDNADRLHAADGTRDREINCGGNSDPGAERDSLDPLAVGCND